MALRVFVDFDGTITRNDVGNALFRRFGGEACDALVDRYRSGEISAQTCFQREAEAMGRFSRATMDAFLDAQEIDASFHGLVEFCGEEGIEICILSDGLDYYIRRILKRHGLTGVPFFANVLSFTEPRDDGSAQAAIAFPYSDAECARCACCKRNLMITRAAEEDIICFVGEGFSDRCPARYADVVS
jgi:2,3-diketo-5-methylthio-1-phosphopentane phosphatase